MTLVKRRISQLLLKVFPLGYLAKVSLQCRLSVVQAFISCIIFTKHKNVTSDRFVGQVKSSVLIGQEETEIDKQRKRNSHKNFCAKKIFTRMAANHIICQNFQKYRLYFTKNYQGSAARVTEELAQLGVSVASSAPPFHSKTLS